MITTYYAKKDNLGFYIQPEAIEDYAKLGYTIYKNEPVAITDIKNEMKVIEDMKNEKAD